MARRLVYPDDCIQCPESAADGYPVDAADFPGPGALLQKRRTPSPASFDPSELPAEKKATPTLTEPSQSLSPSSASASALSQAAALDPNGAAETARCDGDTGAGGIPFTPPTFAELGIRAAESTSDADDVCVGVSCDAREATSEGPGADSETPESTADVSIFPHEFVFALPASHPALKRTEHLAILKFFVELGKRVSGYASPTVSTRTILDGAAVEFRCNFRLPGRDAAYARNGLRDAVLQMMDLA
jgi:hypothetical protein